MVSRTSPRVVVAVSPRMLRDTLLIALRADGLEVVEEPDGGSYDVAVVNGDSPAPGAVEAVIRLADNGGASLLIRHGEETTIDCGTLEQLRSMILAAVSPD